MAVLFALSLLPLPARAGTTGTIVGRIVDSGSGAPRGGRARHAWSRPRRPRARRPTPTAAFRFLSLSPDTYTVTVERGGYEPL